MGTLEKMDIKKQPSEHGTENDLKFINKKKILTPELLTYKHEMSHNSKTKID